MLDNVDFYYFSPTGGTKTYGELFCKSFSQNIKAIDLGLQTAIPNPQSDVVVFALPVFGGRIPSLTAEKISTLEGNGKKAVTLAVYGTRAYEDALLELNNVAEASGFTVIASGAVVAQHSIVPAVGEGRPDNEDKSSISAFAQNVLNKLENNKEEPVVVPGNFPYKEGPNSAAAPICTPECILCGKCVSACPVGAINLENDQIKTDTNLCILCMACTAACPSNARVLPETVQKGLNEKLAEFITIRRKNEYFL